MKQVIVCVGILLCWATISRADKAGCNAVMQRNVNASAAMLKVLVEAQGAISIPVCTGKEEELLGRYITAIEEVNAAREEGTKVCGAPAADYRSAQEQNIGALRKKIVDCRFTAK